MKARAFNAEALRRKNHGEKRLAVFLSGLDFISATPR